MHNFFFFHHQFQFIYLFTSYLPVIYLFIYLKQKANKKIKKQKNMYNKHYFYMVFECVLLLYYYVSFMTLFFFLVF